MRIKKEELFRLVDLIEELKKLDQMIELHSDSNDTFMLSQYEAKKNQLTSYLIKEVTSLNLNTQSSLFFIKHLLDKFYPSSSFQTQKEEDLSILESCLTGI